MDASFLFKHGSAILSKSVKRKLKKIIPAYVEALFSNKKFINSIENVKIVGHASPVYGKKFIDPYDRLTGGFKYNIDLSRARAQNIAFFIVGKGIGKYRHKNTLRRKIRTEGMGYSLPVLSEKNVDLLKRKYGKGYAGVYHFDPRRAPSSIKLKQTKGCGFYNCKKSRRVEITFKIKDDKKALIRAYFK